MTGVRNSKRFLVLLKGHPCTGKSTLAKEISELLSCPVIDKDDVKNPLWSELNSTLPSKQLNQLAYSILFSLVRTQLQLGLHCIVDCPLARRSLFNDLQPIADQCGVDIVLIECIVSDEEVWKKRLEHRNDQLHGTNEAHKIFTWNELQNLIKEYDECWKWSEKTTDLDLIHHTIIDSTSHESLILQLSNLKITLLSLIEETNSNEKYQKNEQVLEIRKH